MTDFKKYLQDRGFFEKFAVNEKAPKFFYDAFKEGESVLFARRDRKEWKVIMDLEFFESLLDERNG
jgi:hypothetical protein